MIEKRLIVDDDYNWVDTVIGAIIEDTDAFHLVNELYEENHQLKRQIDNLEHTRDFCAECCERLEKENEQLKSEIKEVRRAYKQLWMRL